MLSQEKQDALNTSVWHPGHQGRIHHSCSENAGSLCSELEGKEHRKGVCNLSLQSKYSPSHRYFPFPRSHWCSEHMSEMFLFTVESVHPASTAPIPWNYINTPCGGMLSSYHQREYWQVSILHISNKPDPSIGNSQILLEKCWCTMQ